MTTFSDLKTDETPTPEPAPVSLADQPVATISRVTFNYLLIAAVCLLVGITVGYFGYERVAGSTSTSALDEAAVQRAVATAIANLPTNLDGSTNANARLPVEIAGNPTMGPDDAPITMIEFGDFHCGFCKRFQDETIQPLMQQFDGKIKFVFRDYPVLGPDSLQAALAAECAHDQNKFWEFHDRLYAAPNDLTRDAFLQYASDLGLDMDTFTTCYDNSTHRSEVIQDYIDGENAGVSGTPTFFINGRILIGAQPLDTFVLRIESELNEIQDGASNESTAS